MVHHLTEDEAIQQLVQIIANNHLPPEERAKNKAHRNASIADEFCVKPWNKSNKIISDFVFADEQGHNFNRQRISSLLDNLENKKCVQAFAGHEQLETTLNSYYKDITDDSTLLAGTSTCL